jgi:hypothetical protein
MRHKLKGGFVLLVAVLALGGLTATSALAAGAPVVETKPATPVFGTEATLKGKVNPNGATTTYYFEYGTTTGYGSKTPEVTLKPLTEVEVSKIVEGLTPSTTYHFRFVATNKYGTSDGADQASTTTAGALPEFSSPTHGFPLAYKSSLTGSVDFHSPGGEFDCNSVNAVGEVTGAKSIARSELQFTGCKIGTTPCHSEGAVSEEIRTVSLEGKLVYLSKTAKTVAIIFKPVTGGSIAKTVKCGGFAEGDITGSVLMRLKAVNVLSSEFRLNEGTYETYENEAGEKLHAGMTTKMFHGGTAEAFTWPWESFMSTQAAMEVKA